VSERSERTSVIEGDLQDDLPTGALDGLHVVRIGADLATAYCVKLLVDLGADAIVVEAPEGDPLRRQRAARPGVVSPTTAPLAAYLLAGTHSTTSPDLEDVLIWADLVVLDHGSRDLPGGVDATSLRAAHPDLPVVEISPYGSSGPLADAPATEFTVEAWAGLIDARGYPGRAPVQQGGRAGEFIAGVLGAVAGLAALRAGGAGIEVSWLESVAGTLNFPTLYRDFTGAPAFTSRGLDYPSVERCKDGYIGLCLFTAQQWNDFAIIIEQPDLIDDERFTSMAGRGRNRALAIETIQPWLDDHTAEEIVEICGLFRVPVAFIGNGRDLHEHPHLVARAAFVDNPDGFRQPRPPFRLSATPTRPITAFPEVGDETGAALGLPSRPRRATVVPKPLAGVRILDFTAFWAGPSATHLLATLGADVVKVEAQQRPDGMRMATVAPMSDPNWMEQGPTFHAANPGKRSILVDMTSAAGRDVLLRLAASADGVIENFTPRVMENASLRWEDLAAVNPELVMVRVPGFGLDGPWRDRSAFGQTIEQTSGMGWLCGHHDAPPIVRSTCDPIAGFHAALAFLAALDHRDRTGVGQLVEVPMIETALQITAEQTITWSADGVLLERDGNRSPHAAPQGLYACGGEEQWLALSIATDDQWRALVTQVGDEGLRDPALATAAGRHAHHDRIDAVLERWAAGLDRDAAVAGLLRTGVPAAPVSNQSFIDEIPQLLDRGYWQHVQHPVMGDVQLPSTGMWSTSIDLGYAAGAPIFGAHTDEVLLDAGFTPDEIAALRASKSIG
jgi:crotonobetainyl-CoA:carnitine CoA-transferase CaiB-like acyl-CoA transferase